MNHESKSDVLSRQLTWVIFSSRWLQAPLYLGLIVVLIVYVFQFGLGLVHLVLSAKRFHEAQIMLQALDLIDVVMIANLLIMVIVGGYETFVSRLHIRNHPDHPEWLDEVNAGSMKIKLALALIGISSIHLLRTFIDPSQKQNFAVMWQVIIHLTLVVSAISIAFTNKLITRFSSDRSPSLGNQSILRVIDDLGESDMEHRTIFMKENQPPTPTEIPSNPGPSHQPGNNPGPTDIPPTTK